jgi:hypothetical protein
MINLKHYGFSLAAAAPTVVSFFWYLLRRWFPLRATRWEARWFQRSSRGDPGPRSNR